MARFKNGVVKYFKDNIGIIIALLAMCVFLIVLIPIKVCTQNFTLLTLIPENLAACALPPTA